MAIGACMQESAILAFPSPRCLASDKHIVRITYEQDSTIDVIAEKAELSKTQAKAALDPLWLQLLSL